MNNNIILVGMPGVGKSTLGIILAKALGKEFVDTDILLQNLHHKLLQEIIKDEGIEIFLQKEAALIKSLTYSNTIIATGGSVILNQTAMEHLLKTGTIIYLDLDIEMITQRINNIETRGIIKDSKQSLHDIYQIRTPLYKKYANMTINCSHKDHEQVLNEIMTVIK